MSYCVLCGDRLETAIEHDTGVCNNCVATDGGQVSDDINCLHCMDKRAVKRRYGTVGPGTARRTYIRKCPVCMDNEQSNAGDHNV